MDGFDQKDKYHALDLGAHHAQVVTNVEADEFVTSHPKADLIRLAAMVHDAGKIFGDLLVLLT